jgi:death-on-curing protein
MISTNIALAIHRQVLTNTGGGDGIRDIQLQESALSRPFAEFGGVLFYPTPTVQTAALLESLVINHPFVDGNKRTAYAWMATWLDAHGLRITADEDARYDLVIAAAAGELRYEGILEWLQENTSCKS